MRLLKQELLKKQGSTRVRKFTKGQTLVREGDSLVDAPALVVVSGTLVECVTRHVSGHGRRQISLCEVTGGAVTNVQALVSQYALQPAYFTIVAAEDTEVVELRSDGLRKLGQLGELLSIMFRKNMQVADELLALRTVEEDLEEASADLSQAEFDLKIANEDALRWLKELETLDVQLERYKLQAQDARLMMRDAVEALENERLKVTYVGLGMELYVDRIRTQLLRLGLPESTLAFTDDEAMLFTGQAPENLDEIRKAVVHAREIDKIGDGDIQFASFLDEETTDKVDVVPEDRADWAEDVDVAQLEETPSQEPARTTQGYEELGGLFDPPQPSIPRGDLDIPDVHVQTMTPPPPKK